MKNDNLKINQTNFWERETIYTKFKNKINKILFKIITKRNLDNYINIDEIK